jgi:hypothetical protein
LPARRFRISYRGDNGSDVTLTRASTRSRQWPTVRSRRRSTDGVAVVTGNPVDADELDDFILFADWGDGSPRERRRFAAGTEEVRIEHRYADSGNYTINLLGRPARRRQRGRSLSGEQLAPAAVGESVGRGSRPAA